MTMVIDGSNGLTYPNNSTQASSSVVLQVVNATYSTQISSSSSTFVDTGLTASITPKFSTSKILVLVELNGLYKQGNNINVMTRLVRNSTTILLIDDVAGYTGSSVANGIGGVSATYLDFPATTSATTYKTQFASDGNLGVVIVNNTNNITNGTSSTITLMEIAQ